MLSVNTGPEELPPLPDDVTIAAYNSPTHTVLRGGRGVLLDLSGGTAGLRRRALSVLARWFGAPESSGLEATP